MAQLDAEQLAALETFFRQAERRAYRMCLLATSHREEALDIVQDAMLKLAQKYAQKPPELWPVLFYRIVQSRIRDWYRRQRLRNLMFQNDPLPVDEREDGVLAGPGLTPEQQVMDAAAMRSLETALQMLPLRQQQVFLLRAWEGLDVAQTAHIMGCSEGSVKTHYHRALQRLRDELGDFL